MTAWQKSITLCGWNGFWMLRALIAMAFFFHQPDFLLICCRSWGVKPCIGMSGLLAHNSERIYAFLHCFIYSFIHWFISSLIHSFLGCLLPQFLPFFPFLFNSFVRLFVPSFLSPFLPSFLPSFLTTFLPSFFPSFLLSFLPSLFPFFHPSFHFPSFREFVICPSLRLPIHPFIQSFVPLQGVKTRGYLRHVPHNYC